MDFDQFYSLQHVGWWSPTIVRGEDREAVHIPNHKFTVNVVRNLTQKTHWRIKTHLAISHLDVNKINVRNNLDYLSFNMFSVSLCCHEFLLDFSSLINWFDCLCVQNIVADMRKVLAKNPQVEQQRLHRRVFLDNINTENQALLVSAKHIIFVKIHNFIPLFNFLLSFESPLLY
jgi:hypothetical protein